MSLLQCYVPRRGDRASAEPAKELAKQHGGDARAMASDWRKLGCAALSGAVLAFPVGLIVGERQAAPESGSVATKMDDGSEGNFRKVYSPNIFKDPYVLRQQRKVVESLEVECRHFGTHCAEAGQARRWRDELDTSD